MPVIRLTDLTVQSLKPGLYYDLRTPAFGIRVGERRKTWLVTKTRRRLKVAIGHYPEISVAEARRRALVLLGSPLDERPHVTFPEAREEFLAQDRWRASSRRVITSNLKHFSWQSQVQKITREQVVEALQAIDGRSARAHALKDVRALFNWCTPRLIATSPAAGISLPKLPSRERVLNAQELKAVWRTADEIGYPFGTIVMLLILTGQRKSEIGRLRRDCLAGDRITLPGIETKNGREHTFPVSPLAGSLLLSAQGLASSDAPWLFQSTRDSDHLYNGYTFHLRQLHDLSETSGWTLHDLRRTFATGLAALGTPIHVTEKVLNHVSGSLGGIAGIYNRFAYWDEQAAALLAWEAAIKRMCTQASRDT